MEVFADEKAIQEIHAYGAREKKQAIVKVA
jgi:hypothetical protein